MTILTTALIIAAAIAAGCFLAYFIPITFEWLRNKITSIAAQKRVKNVVVADLENLVRNSSNKISLSELNSITGGNRAEVIAGLDNNNAIVGDVEIAKDKNINLDNEVAELLGREKTVVVGV